MGTTHSDECVELGNEYGITWEDNPDLMAELHAQMAAEGLCDADAEADVDE